jgi:hypothetical protein
MGTFKCARRNEGHYGLTDEPTPDYYRDDDTCCYCGSMNPETFMQRLESGDVELGPTDKNYKVYVSGEALNHARFYFQHLNEVQKARFLELLNEKKLQLEFPGHFYVLPFFIGLKT